MSLNSILQKVRSGEMNIDQAKEKILGTLRSDRKEIFEVLKTRFAEVKEGLLSPKDLVSYFLQNKQSRKILNSLFKESSGLFTNYGQKVSEPLLDWIDEMSNSLSKASSDDHEVLLKLSVLKHCDYEDDCDLTDNQLLISRWSDLHFMEETTLRDNIFQASQLTQVEFRKTSFLNNQLQISSLHYCLAENTEFLENCLNLTVINKTEFIRSEISKCEASGVLLHKADFLNSKFNQVVSNNSQIRKTRIENTELSYVKFEKCIFHGCEFKNVKLTGTKQKPLIIKDEELYYCKVENCRTWEEVLLQCKNQAQEKKTTQKAQAGKKKLPAKTSSKQSTPAKKSSTSKKGSESTPKKESTSKNQSSAKNKTKKPSSTPKKTNASSKKK
jgi:uncharacterized protein YjbI with pentapeptide repeats